VSVKRCCVGSSFFYFVFIKRGVQVFYLRFLNSFPPSSYVPVTYSYAFTISFWASLTLCAISHT